MKDEILQGVALKNILSLRSSFATPFSAIFDER